MEIVGDVLKKMIFSNNKLFSGERYGSFFRSWDVIVGEPLSEHTKVIDISGNRILVEADHPGWFQLFQFKEEKILKKIRQLYPELDIKCFRVLVAPGRDETKKKIKDNDILESKRVAKEPESVEATEDVRKNEDINIILKRLHKSIIKKERENHKKET